MNRRRALAVIATSAASFVPVASTANARDGGKRGTLPNENVPHETVHAFPAEEGTRTTGQFLTLRNGWVFPEADREDQVEFFDRTRQTFVYDGQTFVLDSFEDWEPYETEPDRFAFTHTDPPKPKGKSFDVTWDVIYTADFENSIDGNAYEEGDHHVPFPFASSYEIVVKGDG